MSQLWMYNYTIKTHKILKMKIIKISDYKRTENDRARANIKELTD